MIVEVEKAFTLLGDEQLVDLKNYVIPNMHTLNGTNSRGFYTLDISCGKRKRKDDIVMLDIAKAIQEAFNLDYIPARGERV